MVRKMVHAMSESKQGRLFLSIHVATETHGKVLKIIESLNSDAHDTTNQVIKLSPVSVFNFFSYSPIIVVSMKSIFSKDVSTGNVVSETVLHFLSFFPNILE